MNSSVKITVNMSAVSANLRNLKRITSCKLMPVIKSNAYGHGILETARVLENEGVSGLCISEASDIPRLRNAGIESPLFLLCGFWPWETELVARERNVITGICAKEQLDKLNDRCAALGNFADVHIKLDSGMGRYGFLPEEFMEIVQHRNKWPRLVFKGIYSHLANAGKPGHPMNDMQYDMLHHIIRASRDAGWIPADVHMANSSGLIHHNMKDDICTLARPGIAVYGSYPDEYASRKIVLLPAMQVTARVAAVRTMPAGHFTGYGSTFRFTRDTKIAILQAGYDNGYLRALSNRADVLVNGIRCPVLGRISMQAVVTDVTFAGDVNRGDEAILWGMHDRKTMIRPEEAAEWAGTISYELLCLARGNRSQQMIIS